jgi:ribosomal protein L37AE/L43A
MRSTFAAAHAMESSPFTCAALPMVFPEWRGYCVWSEARCPMVCPRCDRARIERDGAVIRCAVCGMSYDPSPDITTHLVEKALHCRTGSQLRRSFLSVGLPHTRRAT